MSEPVIRDARPADHAAFARLFPELGVDDPLPSRERFTDELLARVIIATLDDQVVGYALFEVLAETGYIRNLVTDPACRRTGVGRALMAAMRARFLARSATMWCLNVKPDNVAAITLYERCGLRPAYHSSMVRLPTGTPLPASPDGVSVIASPPGDDDLIEPRFGLLRGQLASARLRPSRHVLQLRREDEPVGIGVFSAAIPGSFPFRFHDPTLAAAFLAHLRTLAPADARYVQVGIEDDPALRDAVIALGGSLRLEILHMRGALG